MVTVLVVDSEPCIRDIVRMTLESRDCRILEASDGARALDLAVASRPDLILLDGQLPDLPGAEALMRWRADAATADVPVILMSGLEQAEMLELRAEGFLLKPFRPVELLSEIQQALNSAPRRQVRKAAA